MTVFQIVAEKIYAFLSAFQDDDGIEAAEIEAEIELCICAGLDPYLSGVVRDLNEQHSAARVVPLRKAG